MLILELPTAALNVPDSCLKHFPSLCSKFETCGSCERIGEKEFEDCDRTLACVNVLMAEIVIWPRSNSSDTKFWQLLEVSYKQKSQSKVVLSTELSSALQ